MGHRIVRVPDSRISRWSIIIYFDEWSEFGIGMGEIMGELQRRSETGIGVRSHRPSGFMIPSSSEKHAVEFYGVAKQDDGSGENGPPRMGAL